MDLIDILMASPEWQQYAACGDGVVDVIRFTNPSDAREAAAAIATCTTCPVIAECRKHARVTGEDTGIWGGVWLDQPEVRAHG